MRFAPSAAAMIFRALATASGSRESLLTEVGVAAHGRQRVVQVVRHHARETPDRLHPVGLAE